MKNLKLHIINLFLLATMQITAADYTVTDDKAVVSVDALGSSYTSIQSAVDAILGDASLYLGGALLTDVEIQITPYSETLYAGITLNTFNTASPSHTLTITSASNLKMARTGAITLDEAKNITLSRIAAEQAISVEGTDITITGCDITSTAATSLNISDASNIIIDRCNIQGNVTAPTPQSDALLKIASSDAVQVLRSGLKGDNATILNITNSTRVLVMNNILWTLNENSAAAYPSALVRLCAEDGQTTGHIGIYYNTMFIDGNGSNNSNPVDFIALGGNKATAFETDHMAIQYNNCYSYSATVPGRSSKPFTITGNDASESTIDICDNILGNNFWSIYDRDNFNLESAFDIGCGDDRYIDVEKRACVSPLSNAASLAMKRNGLNIGKSISGDMSGLGIATTLSVDMRSTSSVRPRSEEFLKNRILFDSNPATIQMFTTADIASDSHAIDLRAFKFEPNTDITLSLTGANSTLFTIDQTDFQTDVEGKLSVQTVNIGFPRPAEEGEFHTTIHFAFSNDGAAMDFDLPVSGIYTRYPLGNGWTLGALQQRSDNVVETIVWNGTAGNGSWDDRNNWSMPDGTPVNCNDILSTNLRVVIPSSDSKDHTTPAKGVSIYPQLPEDFFFGRTLKSEGEQIDAGAGNGSATSMIADHIELEYGASLRGVHHLNHGSSLYGSATTHFNAIRSEWLLVGTVVKPYINGTSGEVRNIVSGDYYIANQLPNVYMREASVSGSSIVWNKSFSSLEVEVPAEKAFAIRIPDQYGYYKFPASFYYKFTEPDPSKLNDGIRPIPYSFNGRFVNDETLPTYKVTAGRYNLLCNTYPANIDADALTNVVSGLIQIYDYSMKSWRTAMPGDEIKSQNGFAFRPSSGSTLTIDEDVFTGNSTRLRSSDGDQPYIYLIAEGGSASSIAGIRIDEAKDDNYNADVDALKIFNPMASGLPDIYAVAYDSALARVDLPDTRRCIPLGIHMESNGSASISAWRISGIENAILEDRKTNNSYDLIKGETCSVTDLKAGENLGRFYLNLAPTGPYTAIDEDETEETDNGIEVYQNGKTLIISSTDTIELKAAHITDMSGRTIIKPLSGHYSEMNLPDNAGVYVIRIAGSSAERIIKAMVR